MTDDNIFIKSLNNYDTICLSGGGLKCFSFIGALEYIENNHDFDIKKIKKYVGTSGGAILGYLLSIGYTVSEIKDFIISFNFAKVNNDISITDLLEDFGLIEGDKLIYMLTKFLNEKYNISDVTFKHLYELTNNELYIIGTNYNKGIERCFSHIHSPDISVFIALRITMSIPIVFKPCFFENEYYIDGAFTNNFPIDYCNKDTTLGMYIRNSVNNEIKNVINLILGTMNILCDTISEKTINDNYNIITIIDSNKKPIDYSDFNLSIEDKLYFINIGYECIKLHIEK